MATPNTAAVKKRKKNWYVIYAPECLNNANLGESTVYGKEELVGKTLKLNLSTFTNDMKRQHIDVGFKVTTLVDNKALTAITGASLTSAYVKRLIRRGRNKIDDSFLARSKDRKLVRVKPIIVTNAKTNRSVTSRLRLEMRTLIRRIVQNMDAEEFFSSTINQRIQKEIRDKLSKIYPLKYVDIRQAILEKDKGNVVVEEVSDEELKETAADDEELQEEAESSDDNADDNESLEESVEEDFDEDSDSEKSEDEETDRK